MQFSKDKTMILTSSSDQSAALWDARTLKQIKKYTVDRPVNSASLSSIKDHLVLAGGQEARDVTTSGAASGRFQFDFFNVVHREFLGSVKGHFGPVNTLVFSPDGKMFASGGEDGYIRLHHLPASYIDGKY